MGFALDPKEVEREYRRDWRARADELRAALLEAVISLEELASAWPQDSLPAAQVCVRMANAINHGNAVIARTRTASAGRDEAKRSETKSVSGEGGR